MKIDDTYIEAIKQTPNKEIREDVMSMAKFVMVKRAVMKVLELSILTFSALGIIPAFLG